MIEKAKSGIASVWRWFNLNLLTPENAVIVIFFGLVYNRRAWLLGAIPGLGNAQFLAPIAAPILSQPVAAFFGRLRENREYSRNRNAENRKQIAEEIERQYRLGEQALSQKKYFDAEQNFRFAKEGLRDLSTASNPEIVSRQIRMATYKQALSLFCMNKLNESLEVVNKELLTDMKNINKDALNLRALIYFKLNKEKEALTDFEASFKIDQTQNTIYIFNLFLQKQYSAALKHIAFDGVAGEVPLKADEPLITYELLQIYGEASMEEKQYQKAILFFNAAERTLPPTIIYTHERIFFLLRCSEAFKKLSEIITDDKKIEIKFLDKTPESLNKEESKNRSEQLMEKAKKLFEEVKDFNANDPRNESISKMINPTDQLTTDELTKNSM